MGQLKYSEEKGVDSKPMCQSFQHWLSTRAAVVSACVFVRVEVGHVGLVCIYIFGITFIVLYAHTNTIYVHTLACV